jgi:exopolyphosphatase / guanosine-5'-triphosphate,3'-diphosphate pyrophosphatase
VDQPRLASVVRERGRTLPHPRATLGVIDIGSNTARFVAFEVAAAGTVRAVYEAKDVPRLGLGAGEDGRLSTEAAERGVATVRRFARVVARLGIPKTLAVATSAVRDASNGAEFVRQVERSTGVLLRILSGAEEARYAYLGVAGAWELSNDLVLDLGGGSLQLAEVRGGQLRNSVSLPLGVLRLSQRYFEHDPPKRREWDELRDHVRETLTSVLEAFGGTTYRLLGIGGTVRSLARAAIELREWPVRRVHGYGLYDHDLDALSELLGEMPAAKRRSIPGIGSDRADVVLAGIVVLEELLRAVKADRIVVSSTGIREGIALEAIGAKLPVPAEALAERSATAAAESFAFRIDHGREVADTALALFDALGARVGGGRSEALALRVAAWMHDAGIAVDLWNHARHSAYLVQNYPIWGLDQREVLLASMATYLHEGSAPPSEWKKGYLPIIGPADLETASRLGAILEVAELTAAARPRFTLPSGGHALAVTFSAPADTTLPPRWAEKVRKPMERAFGLEVRVPHG